MRTADCIDCQEGLCPRHGTQPTDAEERASRARQHRHYWRQWLKSPRPDGIGEGPLFEPSVSSGKIVSRRSPGGGRWLFVTGAWGAVMHHLSFYAAGLVVAGEESDSTIPVEVMTDMQLVEAKYDRDRDGSFSERISHPGFLVLRLGVQMSRNEELPNLVWEVCRVRETRDLPVALVNEPITPWRKGHRAWSPELASYLEDRFLCVTI